VNAMTLEVIMELNRSYEDEISASEVLSCLRHARSTQS
jgi:hypothetical protein